MRRLLACGASVQQTTNDGFTALHAAAACPSAEAMRALLDAGASATFTSEGGDTPLHIASQEDSPESIRLLVDRGASVSAQRRGDGATPLIIAARSPQPAAVQVRRVLGRAAL